MYKMTHDATARWRDLFYRDLNREALCDITGQEAKVAKACVSTDAESADLIPVGYEFLKGTSRTQRVRWFCKAGYLDTEISMSKRGFELGYGTPNLIHSKLFKSCAHASTAFLKSTEEGQALLSRHEIELMPGPSIVQLIYGKLCVFRHRNGRFELVNP